VSRQAVPPARGAHLAGPWSLDSPRCIFPLGGPVLWLFWLKPCPRRTRPASRRAAARPRDVLVSASQEARPEGPGGVGLTDVATLRKVCPMTSAPTLQPTLWRTCRAIANRSRLRMFGLLVQHPGQTVSAVAVRLNQPLSVTSEYLRTLEARGLLTARRMGRRVEYRPSLTRGGGPARGLVAALRLTFERETKPVETVFKLATAFTHPRRIDVFRVLAIEPRTLGQMRATTGTSRGALVRHLGKLEARGFVTSQGGRYTVARRRDALGRELARWAAG
jgi:DNA-binding transcriptional ArsR family regulator